MIVESHKDDCDVCELIERGVKSAGGYYFAGLLAGIYFAAERATPLCPLHFAAWKTFENEMDREPLVSRDAAQ